MFITEFMKDNKLALVINFIITITVLTWKNGGTVASFYRALGAAFI